MEVVCLQSKILEIIAYTTNKITQIVSGEALMVILAFFMYMVLEPIHNVLR